jgi:hypothetical protein
MIEGQTGPSGAPYVGGRATRPSFGLMAPSHDSKIQVPSFGEKLQWYFPLDFISCENRQKEVFC